MYAELAELLLTDARLVAKQVVSLEQIEWAFSRVNIAQQLRRAAEISAAEAGSATPSFAYKSVEPLKLVAFIRYNTLDCQTFLVIGVVMCVHRDSKPGSSPWVIALQSRDIDFVAFRELLSALACVAIRVS